MDCFRSIHMNNIAMNTEPRISTSIQYFTKPKPSQEASLRGLNRLYYNMTINTYTADSLEIRMLRKLHLEPWTRSFVDERKLDLCKE